MCSSTDDIEHLGPDNWYCINNSMKPFNHINAFIYRDVILVLKFNTDNSKVCEELYKYGSTNYFFLEIQLWQKYRYENSTDRCEN